MTLRKKFEAKHPVPQGVSWSEQFKRYGTDSIALVALAISVQKHWVGFQSGYAQGLEDAALAAESAQLPSHYQWGHDAIEQFNFGKVRAAAAIRAMKS